MAKLPRWVKNSARLVAFGLFVLNLIETGQGAPQAAHWLRKVGVGVSKSHLIGMVIAIALVILFGLLAIGPRQLEEWKRRWFPGAQDENVAPAEKPETVRPTFSCEFLPKGDHFWLVISNEGPVEVPDPPLLLNVLFPETWDLHAGGGNFAAASETLTALDGTTIGAWEWSFMEEAPPRPKVRQKYEFKFKKTPAPAIYPVATLIHGYARFDAVLAIGIPADVAEPAVERAKKARAAEVSLHQTRVQDADDGIAKIAPLFGTELRDIRLKIERWKATRYPSPYENLPAHRWSEYANVLAANHDLYAAVERAYDAAHAANQTIRDREQSRRAGNRSPFVPEEGDGLERVHGLAGEALDALGERHNEPYQASETKTTGPAIQPPGQKRQRAKERRKETLLRFADQGEGYRERITRAVYPSPPTIVGGDVSWMVPRILVTKWLSELAEYARLELSEDFVRRIPTVGDPTPKATLAAIDEAIALIEETVEAMP